MHDRSSIFLLVSDRARSCKADLALAVWVSSLALEPLGGGEAVLDVALLEVVGVIRRVAQHLQAGLLQEGQCADVLLHALLTHFKALLSLCKQPVGVEGMVKGTEEDD